MIEKTEIEQAWADFEAGLRARIRFKHSRAAAREINKEVPKAQLKFEKSVQQGILPAPPDVIGALDA